MVTITTDTITGESGVNETVVIAENDGQTDPISIEIDYSGYFDRIATAMETIATNSTTIAENTTQIKNDITRLKELGDHPSGPGIRTIQPYGYIGTAILYLLYIKQGQILEEDFVGNNVESQSLQRFNEILDDMFRDFDATRGGF